MAKKVIPSTGENTVRISAVEEHKVYILDSGAGRGGPTGGPFILKRCNPVGPNGKKWVWIHLFEPSVIINFITSSFTEIIKYGMQSSTVYELENMTDLIEFLEDREEMYIDQIQKKA